MSISEKIRIRLKLNWFLYLFLIICIPLKFNGQELEWIYSLKGITDSYGVPHARVSQIITDGNNDIYIAGMFSGSVDFGDNQAGFVYEDSAGTTNGFVAKLTENKEVLWVKVLR